MKWFKKSKKKEGTAIERVERVQRRGRIIAKVMTLYCAFQITYYGLHLAVQGYDGAIFSTVLAWCIALIFMYMFKVADKLNVLLKKNFDDLIKTAKRQNELIKKQSNDMDTAMSRISGAVEQVRGNLGLPAQSEIQKLFHDAGEQVGKSLTDDRAEFVKSLRINSNMDYDGVADMCKTTWHDCHWQDEMDESMGKMLCDMSATKLKEPNANWK